jgi:hypothetical protein
MPYPTEPGKYWFWTDINGGWIVRSLDGNKPTPIYGKEWQWGPKIEPPQPPIEALPSISIVELLEAELGTNDGKFWYSHHFIDGEMHPFLWGVKPNYSTDGRLWVSPGFSVHLDMGVPDSMRDVPPKHSLRRLTINKEDK